jgi:hypothetical protein
MEAQRWTRHELLPFLQSFLLSKARGSTVMQALSTMNKEGAMTKLRSRTQFT